MQTTDKATTKQRTQWQDSEAQHALTTSLDKNFFFKLKKTQKTHVVQLSSTVATLLQRWSTSVYNTLEMTLRGTWTIANVVQLKPRPDQQHCRSNVRFCRTNIRLCCHKRQQCRTFIVKFRPFDSVECCFDIVQQCWRFLATMSNEISSFRQSRNKLNMFSLFSRFVCDSWDFLYNAARQKTNWTKRRKWHRS